MVQRRSFAETNRPAGQCHHGQTDLRIGERDERSRPQLRKPDLIAASRISFDSMGSLRARCSKGERFTKTSFLVTIFPMLSPIPPSLAWPHPLVQEWFTARFSTPT